jgi:uncharacterized membrane protein HdeD (DUF308 family)
MVTNHLNIHLYLTFQYAILRPSLRPSIYDFWRTPMSTTPATLSGLAPKAINWSIALSVLLILAGLFAIFIPAISGLAITLIFGWLMIISGITHFVFAFKTHTTGGVIWELLVGAVYVFTGVYLILHPVDALFALTLILACYLFFEGIVEIVQYFQIRPRHGAGWLLFDAIITLILAVMIWRSWPASSVWVIGTLVGISMLFSGFSRLMLSLTAKRVLSRLA